MQIHNSKTQPAQMLDRVLFFENRTGVTLTQRSNQSRDYLPQRFFQRPESTESLT